MPELLLGQIWVLTVCKGYQQTTIVGKKLNTNYCKIHLKVPRKPNLISDNKAYS